MSLQPYLDFTTRTAYRAGRITLGYYQTCLRPDFKPDDTPVTAADRAAEEFIRREIGQQFPGHSIIGEEFGNKESDGQPFRWIIDPIDGTKSFMRGVPLYGVLIGLEIEGVVRVGAAYYPALDEMLCAADDLGCWWNGRRARVSQVASLEHAYVCYTNVRNMKKYGREKIWEVINSRSFASRGWSDAYGYLVVATGRAEMMLDPVMNVWDCGPFPPIFREAGGYFGDWQGNAGHDHSEALACNQTLLRELLQIVRENMD